MAVSYKKLWRLLVNKEMSKSDLRKKADIAPNTMTKLRRDEDVSLTILSKICKTLNVDFGDIVEYVPDAEIWDLYNEKRELIGKDHVRGEQLPIDGYHLVVHVWIRNSKGEYLISQRSANRTKFPRQVRTLQYHRSLHLKFYKFYLESLNSHLHLGAVLS